MLKLILKGFGAQLTMLVFSFIVFASSNLTLNNTWLNIIMSVLIVFVYLTLFFSDSRNATAESIKKGEKPVFAPIAAIAVTVVPLALLVWGVLSPLPYDKGIRQEAWFELFMFMYKGVYHMCDSSIICHIITLIPMPVVSVLGYVCGKKNYDPMKAASEKLNKMMYKDKT